MVVALETIFCTEVFNYVKLTRRVSGIWTTDSAETLGYVFEHRNMKKAALLDPNAPKNSSYGHYLHHFNLAKS